MASEYEEIAGWLDKSRALPVFYHPTGRGKALTQTFLDALERSGVWPNRYRLGHGGIPEGTPELPDHPYGYLRSVEVESDYVFHFSTEQDRQRVAEALGNPFGIGRAELVEQLAKLGPHEYLRFP